METEIFYTDNAENWNDVVDELNALATEEEEKFLWNESFVGVPVPKVSRGAPNQDLVPQTLMTINVDSGKGKSKNFMSCF